MPQIESRVIYKKNIISHTTYLSHTTEQIAAMQQILAARYPKSGLDVILCNGTFEATTQEWKRILDGMMTDFPKYRFHAFRCVDGSMLDLVEWTFSLME